MPTLSTVDCLLFDLGPPAEDPLDVQAPTKGKCFGQKAPDPEWLTKFNAVNGVVTPSMLNPGQLPRKSPWASTGHHTSGRASGTVHAGTKRCPICSDCFSGIGVLKTHFIHCVARNGNPQGYCWNDALNDERRSGRKVAELYCRSNWDVDHGTETSTSDGTSSDDPESYEPSESSSDSESTTSGSVAVAPSSRHDRNHDTGASLRSRTRIDHSYRDSVTKGGDDEVADRSLDNRHINVDERAETRSKAGNPDSLLWIALMLMYVSEPTIRAARKPTGTYNSSTR